MTTIERSGSFVVERPYERVVDLLRDPKQVARCLPDTVESVTSADDGATAVIVTGTPAVQTRLRLRLRQTSADEETGRFTYVGSGSAPRSRVEVDGSFAVESVAEGARVNWEGEAHLGGLLASLGGGIGRYDSIVERKIDATIANVRTAVDT